MLLPIVLFSILLVLSVFAPLRLAMVCYLLLSVVDFKTGSGGIGIFNALRGIVCPLILLWRLRDFAGHSRITTAPLAWMALTLYAAVASLWSIFPLSAFKLVGEMAGSFLICMVLLRAGKGGFLTPRIALPVTVGVLGIAILRTVYIRVAGDVFAGMTGDTADRFTAFTTAQAFAALLTALYAVAISSRTLRPAVRCALCFALFIALILDGSRLWLIAMIVVSLLGLFISSAQFPVKILGAGAIALTIIGLVAAAQPIVNALEGAHQYRIAAAITAAYSGNDRDSGLGTVMFRRRLDARAVEMIKAGSVAQYIFGHGTSNGRIIRGDLNKGIGDPNRAVHNEWLRIAYEWGIIGTVLWLLFLGSLLAFAVVGVRLEPSGFARPLLLYLPAFCIGVSGENILAGAGHAENVGLLLVIGIAGIAYRVRPYRRPFDGDFGPLERPERRSVETSSEHAQDGRGVRRSAERVSKFLSSLAARRPPLCAFEEHDFSPNVVNNLLSAFHAPLRSRLSQRLSAWRRIVFLSRWSRPSGPVASLAARSRSLCASYLRSRLRDLSPL